MYSSYTAATFAATSPQIAAKDGVNLEGATTWAFEFEGQPRSSPGFASHVARPADINLPVFNVFRMFGKMSGKYLDRHRRRPDAAG